jgi:hypothetical protein
MTDKPSIEEETIRRISASDYASNVAEGAERLKFQIEFAQSTLRNLHLVNGGAIVALLTLIGNSSANYNEYSISSAFVWFAIGLAVCLAAYFGAFYSQLFFMNATYKQAWNAQARSEGLAEPYGIKPDARLGNLALFTAIFLAVSSLVSFIIGAFVALGGLF